jgi:recombination protein RecA
MAQANLKVVEGGSMDKQKALEAALSQIERAFGKGSVMKLGSSKAIEVEAISTGSIGLDIALGIGGLPKGRVVEIYGPESSGKTTLALHVVAECQKRGGICAFVDAEHALDPVYARKLGVDIVDDLLISQPDTGEQALEITDTLVRSGAVDMLVIDSVAALTPRAELEGEMGDSLPGLQARLMSQALRKLTGSISKTHCMVIFINQIRMKIGVMFGNPETTTGGNALKFYSSVRLDIRRIGAIKDRRRGGRQPDPRQGGQEQGGAAVQARSSSTSCTARAFPRLANCSISASPPGWWRSPARGSPTVASASGRAARTPRISCAKTPTWPMRSRWRSAPMPD